MEGESGGRARIDRQKEMCRKTDKAIWKDIHVQKTFKSRIKTLNNASFMKK